MKLFQALTLIIAISAFTSCKTDFSVNGNYEEKAIVHSILDFNDTLHYVKINKTFLGDGNSLDFAQIPDSSYFKSVEGTVKEVIGGAVVRTFTLKDTLIPNKDEGAFYAPEQKLYYFKTAPGELINPNASLRLNLKIENGRHNVSAETQMISGVGFNSASTSPNANTQLTFAEANVVDNGDYLNPAFAFKVGNAEYFDVRVIFRYNEFNSTGSEIKEFEWKIGESSLENLSVNNGIATMVTNGKSFYEQIAAKVPVDADVTKRTLHSMDFVVTGASEDLVNYIAVSQPSSALAQSKPSFTNLEGALGIFTSRSKFTRSRLAYEENGSIGIRILSVNSTRQLCSGQIVGFERKFCSPIVNDNIYSFYCN